MRVTLPWLLLPLISLSDAKHAQDTSEFITLSHGVITLDARSSGPAIHTLDYGRSVDGIPAFEVVSANDDTSVFEITYAETKTALGMYMSDGPLPLAATADTYRVNRYNITGSGHVSNRLIQGAFRYQKLNLSSPGILKLKAIGVNSKTDNTPLTDLSGFFDSSNPTLNSIWAAGARTLQMVAIPANSIPDFWQFTSDGALVDSLAPQVVASGGAAALTNYTVDFKVKVLAGGFGFNVLADTINNGIYINIDIIRRRITAYSVVDTISSLLIETVLPANLAVKVNQELTVHATAALTDVAVVIDSVSVMNLTQSVHFFGSTGLGALFPNKAAFRDLTVTTATGRKVYSNSLMNSGCLPDFLLGTNPNAVLVDGSRRDRIAYVGDLDIAVPAALVSTHNLAAVLGSIDLLGSLQETPGFFVPNAKIQQAPVVGGINADQTGLIAYSFDILTAVASTYMHTGDVTFARTWAPKLKKMFDWADSQTLDNGLFNLTNPTFGADWNIYDAPLSGVVTKLNMVYAYSLQEGLRILADGGVDPGIYQISLDKLRTAIDSQLWSDDLKAYVVSTDLRTAFAQDSNALAILAGVNTNSSHSTQTIISTLSKGLMTPVGPLSFSSAAIKAGFMPFVSPYATSYHLRAVLAANDGKVALDLMNRTWAPMADPSNANYTGTFWETLDAEGRPASGLITSLCHGWSAGPTTELTRYVLGAQPTQPGWKSFSIAPLTLGLDNAKGRVPTLAGSILVEWAFNRSNGMFSMTVKAPVGLSGMVHLPRDLRVAAKGSKFIVNGKAVEGTSFRVSGGKKFELQQAHKV